MERLPVSAWHVKARHHRRHRHVLRLAAQALLAIAAGTMCCRCSLVSENEPGADRACAFGGVLGPAHRRADRGLGGGEMGPSCFVHHHCGSRHLQHHQRLGMRLCLGSDVAGRSCTLHSRHRPRRRSADCQHLCQRDRIVPKCAAAFICCSRWSSASASSPLRCSAISWCRRLAGKACSISAPYPRCWFSSCASRCRNQPRWLCKRSAWRRPINIVTGIEQSDHPRGQDPTAAPSRRCRREARRHSVRVGSRCLQGIYLKRTLSDWAFWFCCFSTSYGLSTWLPTLYRTRLLSPLARLDFRSNTA